MKNETLMLPHPVEHLKIYDLDRALDMLNPPELFLVNGSAVAPYMPVFMVIEVIEKIRVETLENGECKFFFRLSREVHDNDLWQMFFETYRNGVNVSFHEDMLIICCEPQDLRARYDEICHSAIYQATRDYWQERKALVWQIFFRMKNQERRDRVEADMQAEREKYQEKRRERMLAAQTNGWSVPFLIENLNLHYREILENKFRWWGQILDAPTIHKHRTLFELDLLSV